MVIDIGTFDKFSEYLLCRRLVNHLSVNPTKWSNTQTVRRLLPTNCLNVFDHFVGLALKGLKLYLVPETVSSGDVFRTKSGICDVSFLRK